MRFTTIDVTTTSAKDAKTMQMNRRVRRGLPCSACIAFALFAAFVVLPALSPGLSSVIPSRPSFHSPSIVPR